VYWQSLPQCRFAWPFSRRVGFSSRCFPLSRSFRFFVCRAFAVRRGYPSPVIYLFIFLFHFLIYFISNPRPPVVVAFGHPLPFMFLFYSLSLLAHFQYGWMPHNASFGFLDLTPSILLLRQFWD
jgi:hypothetical protein